MPSQKPSTERLLTRATAGDAGALTELFSRYRPRLKKMVSRRMDSRLAARVDPSDVVQDALLVAAGSLAEYARQRPMPFYPWLRRLAWQRLIDLHRRHRAHSRSIAREEPLQWLNDTTAHHLARRLLSPPGGSHALAAGEQRKRIREVLDRLEESQRELLLLHYVEDLSLAEAAEVLQITAEAARMRHFRALKRLRELLSDWDDES